MTITGVCEEVVDVDVGVDLDVVSVERVEVDVNKDDEPLSVDEIDELVVSTVDDNDLVDEVALDDVVDNNDDGETDEEDSTSGSPMYSRFVQYVYESVPPHITVPKPGHGVLQSLALELGLRLVQ